MLQALEAAICAFAHLRWVLNCHNKCKMAVCCVLMWFVITINIREIKSNYPRKRVQLADSMSHPNEYLKCIGVWNRLKQWTRTNIDHLINVLFVFVRYMRVCVIYNDIQSFLSLPLTNFLFIWKWCCSVFLSFLPWFICMFPGGSMFTIYGWFIARNFHF